MKRYCITATGTDIGKTLVTAALCYQLRQQGVSVRAIKPVASGFNEQNPWQSDAGQLLAAQELGLELLDEICPWRFAAPLSPDMAAVREGKQPDFNEIVRFCQSARTDTITLIEGAGGVMTPVTATHTMLDLFSALQGKLILVAGSYVGTLSHTLTALEAIEQRRIELAAIILSQSRDTAASMEETVAAMNRLMKKPVPILCIPRLDSSQEMWKYTPQLTSIVL